MANTDEIIRRDSELLKRRALQIHRGAARAAVLGVNDGLVSTVCIVLGVAAAGGSDKSVLIAGFAGLIAGAVSMAAGEWISIKSQIDLFNGVLTDLKRMVKEDKELLTEQLEGYFKDGALDEKTAVTAAAEISRNDEQLADEYARHVMGINPYELGSPWTAALSSFALFISGAVVALCPWFFTGGHTAVVLSVIFTGLGALFVGGYVGNTSGTNIARGALKQLFIVVLASVVTYGVGHLFGTVVAG